jgi:hypothetical protein
MSWPTANEYSEAIEHPRRRFCRPELQRAQVALQQNGTPWVRSRQRANVYEMRSANGQDRWAIGCYLQEPQGLARRFELINAYLEQHPAPSLVKSEYVEQGICIRGRWYPITRSLWVEGRPLNLYVREYLDYPDELRLLADAWRQLAQELRLAGIAHGNLAPGTVLVAPKPGGSVTLHIVDYDGVFVPDLEPPEEMGHPDFQHPNREWQRVYDADVDNFSQLVVFTALYALANEGRELWDRFDNGDNLLFRQSDFAEPAQSPLFRQLWQSESSTVRALTGHLILACGGAVTDVPALEIVAGCLKPGAAKHALSADQIERINQLLEIATAQDDFKLEVEDELAPAAIAMPQYAEYAEPEIAKPISKGPPPLPPAAPLLHPLAKTYQFDAWMPEQVAVLKLQGFVKDSGGEVISNQPGFIRVHLLDEYSEAAPTNILSWLGLGQQAAKAPPILAVMELHLVHKPSPTRQLIGITLLLSPGPDDDAGERWPEYCDHIFCKLRGYIIGSL